MYIRDLTLPSNQLIDMSNTENKRKFLANATTHLTQRGSFGRPSNGQRGQKGGGLKQLQQMGALDEDDDMESFALTGIPGLPRA